MTILNISKLNCEVKLFYSNNWILLYPFPFLPLNARSSTPVATALARSSCTRTIPIARRTITYSPLSPIAYYLTIRQTYPTFIVTCLMHHRSKLTFLLLTSPTSSRSKEQKQVYLIIITDEYNARKWLQKKTMKLLWPTKFFDGSWRL